MKFIKKLNEGLGDFDSNRYQQELNDIENAPSINNINSVQIFIDKIRAQIKEWDKDNLSDGFSLTLESYISNNGWSKNDAFLKWLANTDDDNIKALNDNLATQLIESFKDKKLKPDNKYILHSNNLFSESPNDIAYKLNVLYMLSDPKIADEYKNESGQTPTINLIYQKGKFLPTRDIRNILEEFDDNNSNDDDDYITFLQWAHTKGKSIKGKEFTDLRSRLINRKLKLDVNGLNALSDLRKLIREKQTNKLDSLGNVKVSPKWDWGHVTNHMIKELNNKSYDIEKGINIIVFLASQIKDINTESLEKSPSLLSTYLYNNILTNSKYSKNPDIKNKYQESLNLIFKFDGKNASILDKSKYDKLLNLTIPNKSYDAIIEAIIKNFKPNNESNNKQKS